MPIAIKNWYYFLQIVTFEEVNCFTINYYFILNTKTYNQAVKKYSGRLYAYALKVIVNEQIAQDLVQDVFLKLWENRNKVAEIKVKSWLFTSMHNAAMNILKSGNYKNIASEELTDNLGEVAHTFELQDLITHNLKQLPPVQQSILLLRDLEGYNYQEIGELLQLSEAKVKVYLFRARQKMKQLIKSQQVL